jgi:hypothetical protein
VTHAPVHSANARSYPSPFNGGPTPESTRPTCLQLRARGRALSETPTIQRWNHLPRGRSTGSDGMPCQSLVEFVFELGDGREVCLWVDVGASGEELGQPWRVWGRVVLVEKYSNDLPALVVKGDDRKAAAPSPCGLRNSLTTTACTSPSFLEGTCRCLYSLDRGRLVFSECVCHSVDHLVEVLRLQ